MSTPLRARRICSVSSPRPGGSSRASNADDGGTCCASNGSGPPPRRRVSMGDVATTPGHFSANLEIQDTGNIAKTAATLVPSRAPDPIRTGAGAVRRRSGRELRQHAGRGLWPIDLGFRMACGMSASIDYLTATAADRWRSGWKVGGVRLSIGSVMDDRGAAGGRGNRACGRTTGTGGRPSDRRRHWPTAAIFEEGGADFEVRCGARCPDSSRPGHYGARAPNCACRSPVSAGVSAHGRSICEACRERGSSTAPVQPAAPIGSVPRSFSQPAANPRATSICSVLSLSHPHRCRCAAEELWGPVSRGEARFYVTAGTSF